VATDALVAVVDRRPLKNSAYASAVVARPKEQQQHERERITRKPKPAGDGQGRQCHGTNHERSRRVVDRQAMHHSRQLSRRGLGVLGALDVLHQSSSFGSRPAP
jgi:hypothetical protein